MEPQPTPPIPATQTSSIGSSETESALRLKLVPGIGPRTYADLIRAFGSAKAVLNAAPSQLRQVSGVGATLVSAIVESSQIETKPILETCREHDIDLLEPQHASYPRLLREIYDPPSVLFSQGSWTSSDELAIAIVGTRHATAYGKRIAERLARGLAMAGLTIVSGLARGIDAVAHRAALEAGGRTIAVLGGGLLKIYPPEHRTLAGEISEQGVVVSEALPFSKPLSGAFPRRNRILSGISLGVIVVEAAARSGALISARLASEQGREVFAVPGQVDSRMSQGCHGLLRDGAKLVQNADDVLEELGPLVTPSLTDAGTTIRRPAELKLTDQESRVLNAIDDIPTELDFVVERTQLPVSRILSTISVLEMRKLIERVSGTQVRRK